MKRVILLLLVLLPVVAFGAANITLSSIAVGSDGKTVTATLGGGTGSGFGITNGNGIVITARSLRRLLTDQSVSGTTLTLNLGFAIGSGDTVTLSTNSGTSSTIFDSGANTVQSYNNTSVTNNSTVTVTGYNVTASGIKHIGGFSQLTSGSRNLWTPSPSNYGGFAASVTGDEVALVFQGTAFNYSLDGAADVTVNPSVTSTLVLVPVVGSLGGTAHDLVVNISAGSYYFDSGTGSTTQGTILVAGNSNTVGTPSGDWGAQYWFDSSPATSYAYIAPLLSLTTTFGGSGSSPASTHTYKQLQPASSVRFKSDSTFIGLWGYRGTSSARTYVVYQDDVQVASYTVPTTPNSTYRRHILATGLSGTHEYEIVCINPFVYYTAAGWYEAYLELNNSGIMSPAHSARTINVSVGDSITALSSGTPAFTDIRDADYWQAARSASPIQDIAVYALGGVRVVWFKDNVANITTAGDRYHILIGINDASNGTSQASFEADYSQALTDLRTAIGPGPEILCYQPYPCTAVAQSIVNTYGGYIQNAIGAKSNVTYIPTIGWIPRNTTYIPDGVHPNIPGYILLGNRRKPINATTAITVTGPSGGSVGIASANFSVALASGATFTGDQTVTFADGAQGGTFTPSIGSPGTSTITLTPADGTSTFIFTYTPATVGTKTITPTSGQAGWRMPSAMTFEIGPAAIMTTLNATNLTISP